MDNIKRKVKWLENIKRTFNNVYLVRVPEVKNREKRGEAIFKEVMTMKFQKQRQKINLYSKETEI